MKHTTIVAERALFSPDLVEARNEILDAFGALEARITFLLKQAGKLPSKGQSLGHRVVTFRTIEGISEIAKSSHVLRDKLADGITELLAVRADIVHSQMKQCDLDGWPVAIFLNAHEAHDPFPPVRLMTLKDMRSLAATVTSLTHQLNSLNRKPSPLSSPLPPSPGAGGGP